jgi:hypothetical protein|tara:strand:- start:580 stop:762 length:183 start_codon:yes stop_codon:yes gene_type:complete
VNIADSFKPETLTSKRDKFAWESDAYSGLRKKRGGAVPSLLENKSYTPEKNALKLLKAGP